MYCLLVRAPVLCLKTVLLIYYATHEYVLLLISVLLFTTMSTCGDCLMH